MRLSSTGLDLIKSRTGLNLKACQDTPGIWFIGYGHYGDVHEGMEITEAEAQAKLEYEIGRYEKLLAETLQVSVSQGQWDALILLVFDKGIARIRGSSLVRFVNAGEFDKAAAEFSRWIEVAGRPNMHMIKRREAERRLFMQGSQVA